MEPEVKPTSSHYISTREAAQMLEDFLNATAPNAMHELDSANDESSSSPSQVTIGGKLSNTKQPYKASDSARLLRALKTTSKR